MPHTYYRDPEGNHSVETHHLYLAVEHLDGASKWMCACGDKTLGRYVLRPVSDVADNEHRLAQWAYFNNVSRKCVEMATKHLGLTPIPLKWIPNVGQKRRGKLLQADLYTAHDLAINYTSWMTRITPAYLTQSLKEDANLHDGAAIQILEAVLYEQWREETTKRGMDWIREVSQ